MMTQTLWLTGRKIMCLLCILMFSCFYSSAQCTSELGYNDFPFTRDGVTVTKTTAGSVVSYPAGYENCGVAVKSNSFWMGQSGVGSITTNYSSGISKVRVFIVASNQNEGFTFTPNVGTATVVVHNGCYTSVSENTLTFISTGVGGADVEITGSTPFTSLVISHNGVGSGSLVTYCTDLGSAGPAAKNVTGGGAVCLGTEGKTIGLDGSEAGTSYQLKHNGNNIGDAVNGDGSAISFGVFKEEGTYTVVASKEGVDKDMTGTAVITNSPQPQASFSILNDKQCLSANSFKFTNSSSVQSGDLSYEWSFGEGEISNETNPSYSYVNDGTFVVKLRAVNEDGCAEITQQTVVVHPMPKVDFLTNLDNQCLTGNKFVFTNASSLKDGTISHLWQFGDNSVSDSFEPEHVYQNHGEYSVKLISESGYGCKDSLSISVIVHPQPSGTIEAADGTDICEGSFRTLQVSGGNSYEWYRNSQLIGSANSASLKAVEKGSYTVKLISDKGCWTMASNAVNMEFRKTPVLAFDFDKYCKDVPVNFNNKSIVNESGPVQYKWEFGNGENSTIKNPSIVYRNQQEYNVKLTVTPDLCPALVSSTESKISIEAPVAPLRYKLIDASVGNQVTLKARELPASVEWWPATGLSDNHSKSPVLNPSKEQDFKIQYTFASGCTTVDSFLVRVFPSDYIYVPKAFTPNGDGKNDVLRPLNVGIRQLKFFRVYNRWGNLLFETSKMNEGWDGMYRGAKVASDTYVWSAEGIDQNGKIIRRSGSTTLIR